MLAESFINHISPLLKDQGFKKSNNTWRKDQGESMAVFNIQKSPWDSDTFYINLGVYFYALGNIAKPTENKCHVQLRLPIEEPFIVVSTAISWFEERSTLNNAASLAESDSKIGLVFKEVRYAAVT